MLLFASRKVEGETKHAVDSDSSEDCLLNDGFLYPSLINSTADVGVFPLIVFADDREVDVGGLPVLEWSLDTFQQSYRPQVDVLLKGAADRN